MWTISDIVTEVREFILDVESPYRFSDDRRYRLFNIAFGRGFNCRPEFFIGVSLTIPHYTTPAAATASPLDTQYFPAFVDFVTGTIELADDEFAVDGRATAMLNMFQNRLGGLQ